METLELALSEFTKRSRSVLIAHGTTTLDRGLEPGETVLVRDGESLRAATVADIAFELTDTFYRLELGRELDATESQALASATPSGHAVDTLELVALLREARRQHPSQAVGLARVGRSARG